MRTLLLIGPLLTALAVQVPSQPGPPLQILTCELAGPDAITLKVLLLNAGAAFPEDREFELTLTSADGKTQSHKAPVACASWAPDQAAVVRFDALNVGPAAGEVTVSGRLGDGPAQPLGSLVRGKNGQLHLRRTCALAAEEERRILVVAAAEGTDANRFVVKLAYLNCGEKLDTDYWAFLHFEPEATGSDLAATTEMHLYPSGKATDSSGWREDDVTVVTFGSYDIPPDLAKPLYLRAGMYDHDGDGHRLQLAGSGEDDRVLVGRFVRQDGEIVFERIVPETGGGR